jgi:hypothetical protein
METNQPVVLDAGGNPIRGVSTGADGNLYFANGNPVPQSLTGALPLRYHRSKLTQLAIAAVSLGQPAALSNLWSMRLHVYHRVCEEFNVCEFAGGYLGTRPDGSLVDGRGNVIGGATVQPDGSVTLQDGNGAALDLSGRLVQV